MSPSTPSPPYKISPNLASGIRLFLHSQFFITPPNPTSPFTSQTVIVTGANSGLGLEAARHFYRLNCVNLILAVRSLDKGQAAKGDIVRSVPSRTAADADSIKVWELDLSSTESTISFAERVQRELPRLDILVANAGINTPSFKLVEGVEQTVQVNVLNTFLLALMLLPKLQAAAASPSSSSGAKGEGDGEGQQPHLVIVSSEAHRLTKFPEINQEDLYEYMNQKESFSQQPRYQATKLIEILFIRELVARLSQKHTQKQKPAASTSNSDSTPPTPPVIINLVNPGLCTTNLGGTGTQNPPFLTRLMHRILFRTTEVGSRTLVLAACAPETSHGEFQSDGANQRVEGWIYGDVGKEVQRRVFEETVGILEERREGVLRGVGL
ncbi:hypothetical protein BJX70DRAFT_355917 [Aspergillus crustosus]